MPEPVIIDEFYEWTWEQLVRLHAAITQSDPTEVVHRGQPIGNDPSQREAGLT